jgi:hypothetical protein
MALVELSHPADVPLGWACCRRTVACADR